MPTLQNPEEYEGAAYRCSKCGREQSLDSCPFCGYDPDPEPNEYTHLKCVNCEQMNTEPVCSRCGFDNRECLSCRTPIAYSEKVEETIDFENCVGNYTYHLVCWHINNDIEYDEEKEPF